MEEREGDTVEVVVAVVGRNQERTQEINTKKEMMMMLMVRFGFFNAIFFPFFFWDFGGWGWGFFGEVTLLDIAASTSNDSIFSTQKWRSHFDPNFIISLYPTLFFSLVDALPSFKTRYKHEHNKQIQGEFNSCNHTLMQNLQNIPYIYNNHTLT